MQSIKPLPPIKLKNTAKLIIRKNQLIEKIVEHYKAVPQYIDLKHDVEVIEQITQLVLDMISKYESADPKIIILQILIQLFQITAEEAKNTEKIIDYLIANKITAKTKKSIKIFNYISKQFLKLVPN
jgi:predicted glycoside hydrolase/deacetylase ChbG (UPF0249 family)